MKDLFEHSNIIGYKDIKVDLSKYADMICNPDKYVAKGARKPGGILIFGEPGLGKTLIAEEFCNILKSSGVHSYRLRKSGKDDDFADVIKNTFEEAMANEPSIIFLDDLDKFSNDSDDLCDTAEFITCQTYIDECKNMNVYIIATANDLDCIPYSLLREGRFDKKFLVVPPEYDDAVEIIKYYLKDKKHLAEDVSAEEIAKILSGYSCASLESVMNEAAINSAYEDAEVITEEHIVKACLRVIFGAPEKLSPREENLRHKIALHEAGHALCAELLQKKSVALISVANYGSEILGFVKDDEGDELSLISEKNNLDRVKVALAGEAATKLIYNEYDCGAGSDVSMAKGIISNLLRRDYNRKCTLVFPCDIDNSLLNKSSRKLYNKLYKEVYTLLKRNKKKLLALTDVLMKKDYMLQKDIVEVLG